MTLQTMSVLLERMKLPDELRHAVDAYADRKRLSFAAAVVALIEMGLRAYERAVHAGTLGGKHTTSEQARAAVNVRWAAKKARQS